MDCVLVHICLPGLENLRGWSVLLFLLLNAISHTAPHCRMFTRLVVQWVPGWLCTPFSKQVFNDAMSSTESPDYSVPTAMSPHIHCKSSAFDTRPSERDSAIDSCKSKACRSENGTHRTALEAVLQKHLANQRNLDNCLCKNMPRPRLGSELAACLQNQWREAKGKKHRIYAMLS
jgi:hypothetical protein